MSVLKLIERKGSLVSVIASHVNVDHVIKQLEADDVSAIVVSYDNQQIGKDLKAEQGEEPKLARKPHSGRAVRARLREFDQPSVAGGAAGVEQPLRHSVDASRKVLRARRLHSRAGSTYAREFHRADAGKPHREGFTTCQAHAPRFDRRASNVLPREENRARLFGLVYANS